MTTPRTHEDIALFLGAYALDALDPAEAIVVESHLDGCAECRREVDAHREVAAALGHRVEVPPPALWERIAGELGNTEHGGTTPGPATVTGWEHRQAAATPATFAAGRRHRRPRRSGRWGVRAGAAIATVAAVVAIAVLGVDLAGRDQQVSQTRLALIGGERSSTLEAALSAPGSKVAHIRSSSGANLAELVLDPGGRGYMINSSMPKLPAGETYQLWAVVKGTPISIGVLGTHPQVASFTLVGHPSSLAVTVEPAGGVPTPSQPPAGSALLS